MKNVKKIFCVFITLAMVFCIAQPAYAADPKGKKTSSISFSVMSDIHYYPESLMGDKSEEWLNTSRSEAKEYNESDAILTSALTAVGEKAKEEGTKFLLISGDLTRNSEYEAHVKLAERLKEFEAKYGIQVIVTNGNHDVKVKNAATYENNTKEPTRSISGDEFREVYKDLGFDLACEEFTPQAADRHGMLSYVVDLDENYRLIVVDSCIYDPDEIGKSETGGYISDEQMTWIKAKVKEATDKGAEPLVMLHHGLAAHMKLEPSVTFAFPLDDYMDVSEQLADLGVNFAFSGHLHTNDISSVTSDNGNTLYDCETPSLTGFPNQYRNVDLVTYSNGETEATYENVDADCIKPISVDGKTYELGKFKYDSFGLCFGGALKEDGYADISELLTGIASNLLTNASKDIIASGGIIEYLKTKGIDVEKIIKDFLAPYIGDGIGLGGYEIFSSNNIMCFVDDLCSQIEDTYLKNPDELIKEVNAILNRVFSIQVSEIPCTKFIEDYHFGNASRGGNLGEAVLSAMYYWYTGNEDISDDKFIQDVIYQLENGDTAFRIFDELVDIVFNDVLNDMILAKLDVRIDTLFGDSETGHKLGTALNEKVLRYVLRDDFSYLNLVNTIFGIGVLPYTGIYDMVDKLVIKEYLTDSQIESIGHQLAYALSDFATDDVPIFKGDTDVTYSSAKVTPEATRENYRLPTMVSLTMGENSMTTATIGWFSKSTLKDTDIEIYELDGSPVKFSGKATENASFTISTSEESVERYYPGIDLGVIGFFKYYYNMYRHTVKLSGLKPGTKYVYRVGNEKYGWWSETGTIETADGGDKVTFFHMSDPQSQNEKQYKNSWAKTVETAYELYPDAKFIMNTGDLVDCGMNSNQWQWMFDTASKDLMSTYLMPATGNHEEKDDNATVNNFVLPNVPTQDTSSGVYYSYTYNNVHVAVLNTNDLGEDKALNNSQIEWLKEDMQQSSAQWKVVALHKALYSNGSHYDDKDVCAMRKQLSSLMPELNIDLVLQGHDHVYLRTHSLDGNETVTEKKVSLKHGSEVYDSYLNPTGTTYVISGCAGVKTYLVKDTSLTDKLFPRAAKTAVADSQMFSAIEIDGGVMYFNSYIIRDGKTECVDKFAIDKDGSGTVTDETPDILPDEVEDEEVNVLETVFKYFKKIINIAWNIFKMYFIDWKH